MQSLEAELQTAQQRNMTLFTEAPAAFLLLNSQARIQEANFAACGLLGRTRERLLGKALAQFLAPGSVASFEARVRQVSSSRMQQRGLAPPLHADGTPLDVRLDLGAPQQDGALGELRLVITDITPYKRAHLQLLEASVGQERQIQEHAARIRALNQKLEEVVGTFTFCSPAP